MESCVKGRLGIAATAIDQCSWLHAAGLLLIMSRWMTMKVQPIMHSSPHPKQHRPLSLYPRQPPLSTLPIQAQKSALPRTLLLLSPMPWSSTHHLRQATHGGSLKTLCRPQLKGCQEGLGMMFRDMQKHWKHGTVPGMTKG